MALSKIDAANFLTGTIPSGNITTASLAAAATGKVLQVVQATTSTDVSSTSDTFADTGVTANITPSSTSNKVFIMVTLAGVEKRSNCLSRHRLVKGSSQLALYNNLSPYDNTGDRMTDQNSFNYLDSPSSTSQLTYKVQYSLYPGGGSGTTFVCNNNSISTITLMEIEA